MADQLRYSVILVSPKGGSTQNTDIVDSMIKHLRVSAEMAKRLLDRPNTTVKRNMSVEQANKLAQLIRATGCSALVQDEPEAIEAQSKAKDATSPVAKPYTPTQDSGSTTDQSPYEAPQSEVPPDQKVFCRNCGRKIPMEAQECPACGAIQMVARGKSKVVAGILAFFLGGFGMHRFYLGQWWGIFYFLFFWTFVPGLIGMIEAIAFWLSSDDVWQEKHGHKATGNPIAIILVGLISMFATVAIVGVLAAVAVPQYQNYVVRTTIKSTLKLTEAHRAAVETHYHFNEKRKRPRNHFPNSNRDVGIDKFTPTEQVLNIQIVKGGAIVVKFQPDLFFGAKKVRIRFVPHGTGDEVTWRCVSENLETPHIPIFCRDGKDIDLPPNPSTRRPGDVAEIPLNSQSHVSFHIRPKVHHGYKAAGMLKERIYVYFLATGKLASSNEQIQLPEKIPDDVLEALNVREGGTIALKYREGVVTLIPIVKKTIGKPNFTWTCTASGNIPENLPRNCTRI